MCLTQVNEVCEIRIFPGIQVSNGSCQREAVAGANHRCEGALALLRCGAVGAKGANRATAGKAQRRCNRFLFGKLDRFRSCRFINPGNHQRLPDPPFAIASTGKRLGLGQGKYPIIDISQRHHSICEPLDLRVAVVLPSSFAQLSPEVGEQFRPAGGEPADVVQRQFFQLSRR